MAWIESFSEKEASGELARAYEEILNPPMMAGRVPNIIRCMGQRPQAMLQVWRTNMQITFGASALGRVKEEMIATAVSAVNRCEY
jgi:hypothetical protein